MNFANYDLFCAYGGDALAQDELQVLEHPSKLRNYTSEQSQATPIGNWSRARWSINTEPDFEENRPMGLYGWQF